MARARKHFERALEIDPEFAVAHAEFGHFFHRLSLYGFMPPREALPYMQEEARRALKIDPSLPEGHAMVGIAAALFDYNWPEAERHFQLAMANGAVPPRIHLYYAMYCLLPTGRVREAVQHNALGLEEDPLNLSARGERAVCLRAASRFVEANGELRQVLELDPTFWLPYFVLGVNQALDGQFEEASTLADQGYKLAPWFKPIVGFQAAMLQRAGETSRAEDLVQQLDPRKGYVDPIGPAIFHLLRGDLDRTADWVEKAIEQRQAAVFFFLSAHATALRSSARWPALARMMNLPGHPKS